jgi:WD40 repeat protein
MSWSPDFNYLVCPSIDDSKVSLAFALCRSMNFKITYAFFGHASSISCASFSPILYECNGEPCSILALGDSHGAVSIWRISSKNAVTPLLLSNSDTSSNEVV